MVDNLIKYKKLLSIMHREVIERVIEYSKKEGKPVSPKFHSAACKSIKFDSSNFHEIKSISDVNSKNKIAFVDGGSCIIFNAADLALSLVRACCIVFSVNKKTSISRKEFYLITRTIMKKDEIYYNAEIFESGNAEKNKLFEKNNFEFDSLDRNLMAGNHRADIAKITDIMRRLAELRMAKEAAQDLEENDAIIIDGLLECSLSE